MLRGRSRAVRLQFAVASALSLAALAATWSTARAQQPQGTPLPPVPIEPQAQPKQPAPAPVAQPKAAPPPAPAPAPKQAAPAPKVVPKQAAPAPKATPAPTPPEVAATPPIQNALGTYNPALELQGVPLLPGTAVTTAGPVQGYRAISAVSSTKTATPLEQIPQSIQVLPKQLIDDQRPTTVSELVRSVSNTQGPSEVNIGNTELNPFKIRGFGAEQWVDGLVANYSTGHRDAFSNIERVEVLKGPSAILYGGGAGAPIAGAVNMISKLPTNAAGGHFGVTVGSQDYFRPFFDINQPITANGTVLFRVTGEYSGAHSFVDVLESKRYAINPTITFTNKTDTTLTVQGHLSKFEQQAYPGLPAVGTIAGNFRINPWLYAGDPNIMPSYSERKGVTVSLDHRFNPVWSFNAKARYMQSAFDQNSQGPTTAAPDAGPTHWTLTDIELFQQQREFTVNPNLVARFQTGAAKNTVIVGADYSRVTDKGFMYADTTVTFLCPPVDLTNPSFVCPYTRPNPLSPFFFPFFDFDGVYTTKGAYAQVQSSINGNVHLLAGARLANINVNYFERVPFSGGGFFPPETFTVDKTKVLPRAGVVVDLLPGLSVFGSYSEGMRWTAFTQARPLAPEESSQVEAGLKYKIGTQLSGTMSVFDIKRSNVPVTVGVGVADTAEQRSRGFEADLLWQPNSNWKILAAYGYTDAYFADNKLATPQGNSLPNVPAHSGRFWVDYAFSEQLQGLSVGAGIYASSGQFVENANLYKTASFFTIDSKIAYDTKNWTASLHVKNLTGEKYFTPYSWLGGQVAPGAPREVFGTLTYKY
jgi:iron complex outermembrane receptor protein